VDWFSARWHVICCIAAVLCGPFVVHIGINLCLMRCSCASCTAVLCGSRIPLFCLVIRGRATVIKLVRQNDRGAAGAEVSTSRWDGVWGGVSTPQPTRVSGGAWGWGLRCVHIVWRCINLIDWLTDWLPCRGCCVCMSRRLDSWRQFLKRWIASCVGQSWQLCHRCRCCQQQQACIIWRSWKVVFIM